MKLLSLGFGELSAAEQTLLSGLLNSGRFGYLLLNQNPGGLRKSSRTHAMLCGEGLLVLQVFLTNQGEKIRPLWENLRIKRNMVLKGIREREEYAGRELFGEDGELRFRVRVLTAFPNLKAADVPDLELSGRELLSQGFAFREQLPESGEDWDRFAASFLSASDLPLSAAAGVVEERTCGPILRWLDPDLDPASYAPAAPENVPGADGALLEAGEDDRVVRLLPSYWLENPREELQRRLEQVNRFPKGDSRIIGCAGSGKSAVLTVKCFKAAQANPGRRFLITCFNRHLRASYQSQIESQGLAAELELLPSGEEAVECLTFDALCLKLLTELKDPEPSVLECLRLPAGSEESFPRIRQEVRRQLDQKTVSRRYYGILIDEAQQFDPEWLRICYDLLENRDSQDHLFVLCGDITQKMRNLDVVVSLRRDGPPGVPDEMCPFQPKAQIRAPWEQEDRREAGRRYPDFRFLSPDRVVRLDRNYRSCREIHSYLQNLARAARKRMLDCGMIPHPEEFPAGEGTGRGQGVFLYSPAERSNRGEARAVVWLLKKLHDEEGIPYSEISILYYNKTHRKGNTASTTAEQRQAEWQAKTGWGDRQYDLETPLRQELRALLGDGGFCWAGGGEDRPEEGDIQGVTVLSCESASGLSRRAVILCGLLPLGEVDAAGAMEGSRGTKDGDWGRRQMLELVEEELVMAGQYPLFAEPYMRAAWENLHTLYMACSRAREVLYIILPESSDQSVYVDLLLKAGQPGVTNHQKPAD